jgi:hypothetical protein
MTIPSYLDQGRAKFCTRSCYYSGRVGKTRAPYKWKHPQYDRNCEACGALFRVGWGTGRREAQRLCSLKCQKAARYRSSRQSNALSIADAAYIAGFIDGEGSIMLVGRTGADTTLNLRVSVANTDRPILEWLVEVIGVGWVYRQRDEDEKHRASWAYRCHAEGAETLLRQIRPYLRIKAAQADMAIEAHARLRVPALKADRAWQDEWKQRMRLMNQRGPRTLAESDQELAS